MNYFVAAKVDTKEILEVGGRSNVFSDSLQLTKFINALSVNHGTPAANIAFYYVDSQSTEGQRAKAGDEYALVWSGDQITGIDFSLQDAKRWVRVTATKTEIAADGVDSTDITIDVLKADKTGIDTNVNATSKITISTPTGPRTVTVSVVNGTATRTFKTAVAGIWRIPSALPSNVRLDSGVTIDAEQPFSEL